MGGVGLAKEWGAHYGRKPNNFRDGKVTVTSYSKIYLSIKCIITG